MKRHPDTIRAMGEVLNEMAELIEPSGDAAQAFRRIIRKAENMRLAAKSDGRANAAADADEIRLVALLGLKALGAADAS